MVTNLTNGNPVYAPAGSLVAEDGAGSTDMLLVLVEPSFMDESSDIRNGHEKRSRYIGSLRKRQFPSHSRGFYFVGPQNELKNLADTDENPRLGLFDFPTAIYAPFRED